MKPIRRLCGVFVLGVLAATLASCASSEKPEKQPFYTSKEYEENAPPPPEPDDPCKERGGEPRECRANEDCCEGYQCSLDPERSRILRFCMEG